MMNSDLLEQSQTEIWQDGSLVAYDRVPYRSHPFAQSHPDRAATIAVLLGLKPPPVETARVLELGCASGGNLLPMAVQLPNASFVGIDGSKRQIDAADDLRRRAELSNVELRHQDIMDFHDSEPFDYIIAHGVFSWVPEPVQARIFEILGQSLAPNGLAYVSYNVYPGWHLRGLLREMMMFAAQTATDPEEQLAKAIEYVESQLKLRSEDDPLAKQLRVELEIVRQSEPYYVLHDHLEQHNLPVYFDKFMQRAAAQGMAFLGEAEFALTDRANLPTEMREQLEEFSDDLIRSEQHLDFLRNNTFRQTILCRSDCQPDRSFSNIDWNSLWIATDATVDTIPIDIHSRAIVHFRRQRSVMRTNQPLVKAAMMLLTDEWPQAIAFGDLLQRATAMVFGAKSDEDAAETLAHLFRRAFGVGMVELRSSPPRLQVVPSERPHVPSLARLQSVAEKQVTNMWHQLVQVDALRREVMQLSDGTRTPAEIAREMAARRTQTPAANTDAQIEQALNQSLETLGRLSLLT